MAKKNKKESPQDIKKTKLKIGFLGGVGEIGKNMTVLEFGDDIIIVDCGLTFPNFEETPGIEAVIPDYTYILENKNKVKGIFVTHGHEDHIGGLPYLLKEIKVPVYASNIALGILESKLSEAKVKNVKMYTVSNRSVFEVGNFKIEFIRVTHSIAGSYALSITTPKGVIVMTGDFKIDHTPIDGQNTDLTRLAEIGNKGVLLLMMDSTNVERPGYSMSEKNVYKALEAQFEINKDKRIIVSTFASNIHRVQQIINVAISHGRKICFLGRSMIKIAEIAKDLGELKYNYDYILEPNELEDVPYDRLCIICTGTQGEPRAALTRMSKDDFKGVKISDIDTVLFSASAIPGNERTIYDVINELSKRGAEVVYQALAEIHVSGHSCQEELKLMFALLKPKYFIPMHGEYRHLLKHKELAIDMGVLPNNIYLPDIGCQIEIEKRGIKVLSKIKSGEFFVDGKNLVSDTDELMATRKIMANEGLIIAVVTIGIDELGYAYEPEIICEGIIIPNDVLLMLKNDIMAVIAQGDIQNLDEEGAKDLIKRMIIKKMRKALDKFPIVIPILK